MNNMPEILGIALNAAQGNYAKIMVRFGNIADALQIWEFSLPEPILIGCEADCKGALTTRVFCSISVGFVQTIRALCLLKT